MRARGCIAGMLAVIATASGCHHDEHRADAPRRSASPATPETPPDPSSAPKTPMAPKGPMSPVIIAVEGDSFVLDGQALTPIRPASAPGRVDDRYRASYRDPVLAAAVPPSVAVTVHLESREPISTLRTLLASLDRTLEVHIEHQTLVVEPPRSPRDEASVAHRRPDGWSLWVGGVPQTGVTLAMLKQRLPPGPAHVDLLDTEPIATLASLAAELPGRRCSLRLDHDPCVEPPPGMACVPGGPAIVGFDDGVPEEAPARELLLSTFYIDIHEVTNADYDACHRAGACPMRINRHQPIMKPFVGPTQPAMPMTWDRARAYCAWAGKRLPTEWEWEKAARGPEGTRFPWGDEPPSCDKAIYRECAPYGCEPYPGKPHRWDCNEHATRPVGSFPPGHYGLHDMAGNGYEWTASAGVHSIAECGDRCRGRDPLGPCDGATPCNGTRVLRGGSWYWPKHRMRGSHRRIEVPETGSHRLGMRCATDFPTLTAFPTVFTQPRPVPAVPEPPHPHELAIVDAIAPDPIEDKPICDAEVRQSWSEQQRRGGRSTTACRDPFPYLESNEPRGFVWAPYIENLGGVYIGIGSDQNYSAIARVQPQWAWVIDYDPRVIRNHLRLLALIRASDTPQAFIARFAPENQRSTYNLLGRALREHPDVGLIQHGFNLTRERLYAYFDEQRRPHRAAGDYGWLRNDDDYQSIRTLALQGRLRALPTDLLADGGALTRLGEAATALGLPVRVFYTSNAPSSWGGQITPAYRANVLALPFDEGSVVLQTNSRGGFAQANKWHHNVSWGWTVQQRLRLEGYDSIPKVLEGRIPGEDGDLTLLGLPSAGRE